MPRQTNPSADVSASSAELNPLLNPLLADHMDRWAKVYFTSPPEEREDAVLSLLRELQVEKLHRDKLHPGNQSGLAPWPVAAVSAAPATPKPYSSAAASARASTAATNLATTITATMEEPAVQCSSCGHENPVLHRYCGGCGATLSGETNSERSPISKSAVAETRPEIKIAEPRAAVAHDTVHDTPHDTSHDTEIDEIRARLDPQRRQFEDSIAHPGELSLFRSFREQDAGGDEWEETSTRRRFLLAGALIVLIAGAVYMAWRSGQLSARHPQEGSSQSAVAKDNSAAGDANTNAPNTNADEPKPAPKATKAVPTPAEKPQAAAKASPIPARQQPVQQVSNVISRTPASSVPIDNGSEELAVAQHYLSGDNGRRDSAEAAKWLWKSISKHNGEATVMLADLYLKGDGVSKNCDQARVLLDTAGRKGVAGAGQRLRNLQAFGCQ